VVGRIGPLLDRLVRPRTVVVAVAACAAVAAIVVGFTSATTNTTPPPVPADDLQHASLSEHGDAYGYAVYVPSGLKGASAVPLVVVLHGCSMTAGQMAAASGYDALAQRDRFVVLYPDVDSLDATAEGRCWRGIWAPEMEGRGAGDTGAIAAMTRAVMRRWPVDAHRVYAIGISAGAFEASILGTSYPDLYAAIGLHSGAAYMGGQPQCLPARQSTAETDMLAHAGLAAMGARARVVPVFVIHGDADQAVPYGCGQQAIAQWLLADNLLLAREHRPAVPDSAGTVHNATVPGGRAYSVLSYAAASGCPLAQLWTVHGMGHFWSGGSAAPASARFSDPRGPSATAASWAFFSRWTLSGPLGPCTAAER
jgi:poly(hydroxyalkanoate) depolymerase family esterase